MRLSRFILDNLEDLLQDWESFARSLPQGPAMSIDALRDDAEKMLRFVATDMESAQTRPQEIAKATGHGAQLPAGQSSAAHVHGVTRAVDRFSLTEVISEYRALRASVTRRWIDAVPLTSESVAEIIRFNEAIDQILAEGIARFTERLDQEADLFTASVGHDLSNPVNAVMMSARSLMSSESLSAAERAAVDRITRASERLSGMVDDLRDFTRTRLGGLITIQREPCDLSEIVSGVVNELEALYGTERVLLDCEASSLVDGDRKRLAQLASNLIANALQHGDARSDVGVRVFRAGSDATLEVHNSGVPIGPAQMKTLFDPMAKGIEADEARLGLGLYIVRQIAVAHGGQVDVTSSERAGTRFTVRLPSAKRA
jgi:signal transduction histidine kinase